MSAEDAAESAPAVLDRRYRNSNWTSTTFSSGLQWVCRSN